MDNGRDFSSTSQERKYVKIQDQPRSQIDPIPYYPNLHRQLHSFTASILLAYLEIHHPAPQDHPDAPVSLQADAIAIDIQIARRTLLVPLSILAVFWKAESARARGARANREFVQPDHSRHGQTKPYSITGPKSLTAGATWLLRRNWPFLRFLLQQANSPNDEPNVISLDRGDNLVHPALSLGQMIVNASVLGVDGRVTKAERLRRMGSS